MNIKIHVESPVALTTRVTKLREIFDLPLVDKVERDWSIDLPENYWDWNVGLVVGPSGSGKTRMARELWGDYFAENYEWPRDGAVIDGFDESLDVNDVAQLLTNVGFSSPPSWLRPFHTLSNGEQFRASLARAIVDERDLVVIDEFTSVVDRTVAQIGSCAFAREVRKRTKRAILLSCHYDVIDWLQPDWIFYVDESRFERRVLQRRPSIDVDVRRCDKTMWKIFSPHHYLTSKLPGGAHCMVGLVRGRPAVFTANVYFPISAPPWEGIRNIARLVCLPDFQGIGLGGTFNEYVASLWKAQGWRVHSVFAHPAVYAYYSRRPTWTQVSAKRVRPAPGATSAMKSKRANNRATWTFAYTGPAGDVEIAKSFDIRPQ